MSVPRGNHARRYILMIIVLMHELHLWMNNWWNEWNRSVILPSWFSNLYHYQRPLTIAKFGCGKQIRLQTQVWNKHAIPSFDMGRGMFIGEAHRLQSTLVLSIRTGLLSSCFSLWIKLSFIHYQKEIISETAILNTVHTGDSWMYVPTTDKQSVLTWYGTKQRFDVHIGVTGCKRGKLIDAITD